MTSWMTGCPPWVAETLAETLDGTPWGRCWQAWGYDGPPPRQSTTPVEDRAHDVEAVGAIARLLGAPLLPWQRWALRVETELLDDGTLAHPESVETAPRQVGKTTLGGARQVRAIAAGPVQVRMAAQDRDASRDRLLTLGERAKTVFGSRVRLWVGRSAEELRWVSTGGSVRIFAGKEGKLDGSTLDRVWVDELWAMDAVQAAEIQASYRPAMQTRWGTAHTLLTSTRGPHPGSWLALELQRGVRAVTAGTSTGVSLVDWSVPPVVGGVPVAELDDERLVDLVWWWHPGRQVLVQRGFLAAELEAMRANPILGGTTAWLRAYGNHAPGGEVVGWVVIDEQEWARAEIAVQVPGPSSGVLGVAADEGGRIVVVGAGMVADRVDTRMLVEGTGGLLDGRPAVEVLAELAAGMGATLLVDVLSPAARSVADDVERRGVAVERITGPDAGAAVARVQQGLRTRQLGHRGGVLTDAARAAQLVRGRWAGPEGAVLAAMAAAVWGASRPPSPPPARFELFVPRGVR